MSISAKQLGIYLSLLLLGGGAGTWASRYLSEPQTLDSPKVLPAALQPLPLPSNSSGETDLNFIAKAVEQVGSTVVRIDASREIGEEWGRTFENPFFRGLFPENHSFPQRKLERGTGSGFIFSSDGKIVTNAHVIADSDQVRVTLTDGRVFDGEVVGTDPITDVAVIKIDTSNLPTAQLGQAELLIPGEWAIAIGNPLGLDNTVTVGIISAVGRSSSEVGVVNKRVQFIQTDAAINPGNSGGPLLNASGEVIGINTAIRANAQGLGFAIPIETVEHIAQQLLTTGQAAHPYLGIQMVTLDLQRKKEIEANRNYKFKVNVTEGILITRVIPNSPAAKARFQPGDLIKKVGGKTVKTATDVQQKVEKSQIGQLLIVEVEREGQAKLIEVIPGEFPIN